MEKFKGTPGPWLVNVIGPHWNNKSLTHIEVTFGEDGECVCDTVYSPDDAKLIAAAPDLLEALRFIINDCSRMIPKCAEDKAIAAINKALGEKQ